MSRITPEIREEVLAEHAKNPQRFSPFRTATALGIPTGAVMEIVQDLDESKTTRSIQHGGEGRPELREFLVGRRKAMAAGWDNKEPAIAAARAALEAGTHIMTTGRDGPWLLLYSIPRKGRPDPRPNHFSTEHY